MTFTYEDVNPTIIANTAMQKGFINGVHKIYTITPNAGYVLHDNVGDLVIEDEITGEEIKTLAFFRGTCTCGANYDFTVNSREFYAVLESSVPADQIFGGGDNNNHEVM
jgi:hypothetical protein